MSGWIIDKTLSLILEILPPILGKLLMRWVNPADKIEIEYASGESFEVRILGEHTYQIDIQFVVRNMNSFPVELDRALIRPDIQNLDYREYSYLRFHSIKPRERADLYTTTTLYCRTSADLKAGGISGNVSLKAYFRGPGGIFAKDVSMLNYRGDVKVI